MVGLEAQIGADVVLTLKPVRQYGNLGSISMFELQSENLSFCPSGLKLARSGLPTLSRKVCLSQLVVDVDPMCKICQQKHLD